MLIRLTYIALLHTLFEVDSIKQEVNDYADSEIQLDVIKIALVSAAFLISRAMGIVILNLMINKGILKSKSFHIKCLY